MISNREAIDRIAKRVREQNPKLTQEQARKTIVKIRERLDRKKQGE